MHCSGFGIFSSIDQRADAGVDHGSCAHGAWLYGHEEIAASQAVIAEGSSGFAQGDDFSMRCGIGIGYVAIESAANDFAFMHYDRADRNLAYVERSLSSAN